MLVSGKVLVALAELFEDHFEFLVNTGGGSLATAVCTDELCDFLLECEYPKHIVTWARAIPSQQGQIRKYIRACEDQSSLLIRFSEDILARPADLGRHLDSRKRSKLLEALEANGFRYESGALVPIHEEAELLLTEARALRRGQPETAVPSAAVPTAITASELASPPAASSHAASQDASPTGPAMTFDEMSWEDVGPLLPIDALVMTAVRVELRAVRSLLAPPPGFARIVRLPWEESTYYLGKIGRYTCAVVMSEAGSGGRAGAALTLHDAIGRLLPTFVLSVGIAFGRSLESQKIADVLVSTMVIPYESERVQAEGDIPRAPHPEAGIVLLNRLRTLDSEDAVALKIHFGPLLSGEKLVDDAVFKEKLLRKHPNAIGGEMEAAGIYAAAARKRLEWVVIKSICDWGDGTKTKQYQDQAAQNASEVTRELLSRGGLERAAFSPTVLSHRPTPRPSEPRRADPASDPRAEPVAKLRSSTEERSSENPAYEQLVQRVFETLLNQGSVANVCVERDAVLKGVAAQHDVAVYWEFAVGGITYRTVVECVADETPVDSKTVLALQSVLADLAGQPRGVIVSRGGFSEDTKRYAEVHGIVLYELRQPRDDDWKGFVTGINITGELLVPKMHGIEFKVDEAWATTELKRAGLASLASLPQIQGSAGALIIEREDGSALTTVGHVIEEHLCPSARGLPEWREHLFAEPAYIRTGLPQLPRIRLRGVRASVELVVGYTRKMEVRLEPLVGLILKQVSEETFSMFDAQGRPLEADAPRPARIVSADDDSAGDRDSKSQ